MPAPRESAHTRQIVDVAFREYAAAHTQTMPVETLATHHRRYHLLMAQVAALISTAAPVRILDIGPRFEVDLMHRLLPSATIDTLGLNAGLYPPREGEHNHIFDLSRTDFVAERPDIGPYDLIVMAEVFEHISMPPSIFMPWLASLLAPRASLIVQTPNAVALPKRLRMAVGRHPFWQLTADRAYPGHYREYTITELKAAGRQAGLEVASVWTANYFDSAKLSNRIYGRLERLVPPGLRAGITIVFRNGSNAARD
jgi:hypothetical protein